MPLEVRAPGGALPGSDEPIARRLAVDRDDVPATAERSRHPGVQIRFRRPRPHVMERERRDDRVAGRQRRADEVARDERGPWADAARRDGEHRCVDIDARQPCAARTSETSRGEGAGAGSEIDDVARVDGDGCSGDTEHLLVIRDERPDPPVVFAELDAEVRGDAHARDYIAIGVR